MRKIKLIPSMGIKREKIEKINPRLYVEVCATKKKKKKIKSVFSLAMGDCIAQRKAGEIWLKGLNFIFLFSQKKTNTKSACLELHDWTFLSLQLDE